MSAVLHPSGPEEPRTYWIRRGVVLAAVILVVLVILWAFRPADGDVQAVPGASPSAAASPPAAPVDSTATPSAAPVDSTATPSAAPRPSPSASSAGPSGGVDRDVEQEQAEQEKAEQEKAEQEKAEQEKAEQKKAEQKKKQEPVACTGGDVAVTLAGSSRPVSGEDHDLLVTLTNETSGPCDLELDQDSVELRVFSGSDEIWTTAHCADWLAVAKKDRELTLEPGRAHTWTPTWPVQRSEQDCELVDQTLGAGTYVATVVYAGAEPAQLVMVLR